MSTYYSLRPPPPPPPPLCSLAKLLVGMLSSGLKLPSAVLSLRVAEQQQWIETEIKGAVTITVIIHVSAQVNFNLQVLHNCATLSHSFMDQASCVELCHIIRTRPKFKLVNIECRPQLKKSSWNAPGCDVITMMYLPCGKHNPSVALNKLTS